MTLLREIRLRIIDALYVLVVGVTRTQLEQAMLEREACKTDGNRDAIRVYIDQSDQLEQYLSPHQGVVYALLYALDHAELTEHGGSVHAGWLTPKGERVLAFLRVFGGRIDDWPDGLHCDQENGDYYNLTDEQAEMLRK